MKYRMAATQKVKFNDLKIGDFFRSTDSGKVYLKIADDLLDPVVQRHMGSNLGDERKNAFCLDNDSLIEHGSELYVWPLEPDLILKEKKEERIDKNEN